MLHTQTQKIKKSQHAGTLYSFSPLFLISSKEYSEYLWFFGGVFGWTKSSEQKKELQLA